MQITGHRPKLEEPAMTRFLFLKADWNGRKAAAGRNRPVAGIDPTLLLLLSTRYV